MIDWSRLLETQNLVFLIPLAAMLIPITAIVMSGLNKIVRQVIVHRERMTMIERGVHPDYAVSEVEEPAGMAATEPGTRR